MAKQDYEYKEGQYSVTSLLRGLRETILLRRYHDDIEQDVSDMIWLLFGTAIHTILENQETGEHEKKEKYMRIPIGGYKLSGMCDLYNEKTKTITDYKTCSVWAVIFGDYEGWRKQLLIYAYMLRRLGYEVERGEIIALMKDHSKAKAKFDAGYPQLPVEKITFDFTEDDFIEIEKWLYYRFAEISAAERMTDDELPVCSLEDRFNSGDKYAVMKKGRKRAMRVLDSRADAETWMSNNGGDFIEERPGQDKKCSDYCRVNQFCNYYKGGE